jgi:hypothetical protein
LTNLEYPQDVIRELVDLRTQSEKGVGILAEAERKHVQLHLEAERAEALAFLEAEGTVADRTAIAKLKSIDAKQEAELAKVEVNRIKTKLKQLSEATMATQTASRMIELQFRTSNVNA